MAEWRFKACGMVYSVTGYGQYTGSLIIEEIQCLG